MGRNVRVGWGTVLYGNVVVEEGSFIGRNGWIVGNVIIGKYTGIGDRFRVHSKLGRVIIGSYCAIGSEVVIHGQEHNYKKLIMSGYVSKLLGLEVPTYVPGDTVIGNCCWIGDRVIITAGSKIGDGSVVGAGYVVREEIEPYTVVSSKGRKKRFSEEYIKWLEREKPCDGDLETLKRKVKEWEKLN